MKKLLLIAALVATSFFANPFIAGHGAAFAQNPDYVLSIGDVGAGAGGLAAVPINLSIAAGADTVEAWSFGVCSDPLSLSLLDAVAGSDILALAGGNPAFFSVQSYNEGFTVTSIVDFLGTVDVPVGTSEILLATYVAGSSQVAALDFCDTLGTPPVAVVLSADATTVSPTLDSGSVDITGVAPPGEFIFQIPTRTVFYDEVTGEADFPIALSVDQTAGLNAVVGLTMAFAYDANLCTATGASPRPLLNALNGGAGPDFFAADLVPGGVVLNIDTGAEPLILLTLGSVATVDFTANAANVLAAGPTSTALTYGNVLVAGATVSNTVALGGGGSGTMFFSNGAANFIPSPFGGGNGVATLYLGDATTSTDEAAIPVSLSHDGSIQGFSYGVCHDPVVLDVERIDPGIDILTANNGGVADFMVFAQVPDEGWTSGVIISFTGTDALTNGNNEIGIAIYNVLDSSGGSTQLDFCEIGSPPVELVLIEMPGVVTTTPTAVSGTLTFTSPVGAPGPGSGDFARGDVNGDGSVEGITDALFLLNYGFTSGQTPQCLKAADVDGNGSVQALPDALYLLLYQFSGGDVPPFPGLTCGADLSSVLSCVQSPCP